MTGVVGIVVVVEAAVEPAGIVAEAALEAVVYYYCCRP